MMFIMFNFIIIIYVINGRYWLHIQGTPNTLVELAVVGRVNVRRVDYETDYVKESETFPRRFPRGYNGTVIINNMFPINFPWFIHAIINNMFPIDFPQ